MREEYRPALGGNKRPEHENRAQTSYRPLAHTPRFWERPLSPSGHQILAYNDSSRFVLENNGSTISFSMTTETARCSNVTETIR